MHNDIRQPTVELKRSLGLVLLTFYGLGNILGAGIYVLIGKVAGVAGLYAPVAVLIASCVAAVSALSYAELAARMPQSAGEAVYVYRAFGRPRWSLMIGLMVVVVGLVSSAAIIRGFAGYFKEFVILPDVIVISGVMMLLGALAIWGIAQSVWIATLLTLLEIGGLMMIIFVTAGQWGDLAVTLPTLMPPFEPFIWQGIFMGAFLAFYAYIGFEDMVNVAEEVHQPERTLPWAIILALMISAVLYFLVSIGAILTVAPATLAASEAPLALVYRAASGEESVLISQIALFAVVNGALIQIIMASRILYGMSRQSWLPAWLAWVSPRTRTPVYATMTVVMMVLALALWLPLVTLAKLTSLIVLIIFACINLALWVIKRREPTPDKVHVYPLFVPVLGFVLTLMLVGMEAWGHLQSP